MKLYENYKDLVLCEEQELKVIFPNGEYKASKSRLMKEHRLEVYINDALTYRLMCLPQLLGELILGRMITEGIIASSQDVESIAIDEAGEIARVKLIADATDKEAKAFVELTYSSCVENHSMNNRFVHREQPEPLVPISWRAEDIFAASRLFAQGTPLYRETFSAHSCFLFLGDELLFKCEDIGRHNAIDKTIGYGLINRIELEKCTLFSSGRLTGEMIMKAVWAGISVIVSKASASYEAVELGRRYNITVIANARADSFRLIYDAS